MPGGEMIGQSFSARNPGGVVFTRGLVDFQQFLWTGNCLYDCVLNHAARCSYALLLGLATTEIAALVSLRSFHQKKSTTQRINMILTLAETHRRLAKAGWESSQRQQHW